MTASCLEDRRIVANSRVCNSATALGGRGSFPGPNVYGLEHPEECLVPDFSGGRHLRVVIGGHGGRRPWVVGRHRGQP